MKLEELFKIFDEFIKEFKEGILSLEKARVAEEKERKKKEEEERKQKLKEDAAKQKEQGIAVHVQVSKSPSSKPAEDEEEEGEAKGDAGSAHAPKGPLADKVMSTLTKDASEMLKFIRDRRKGAAAVGPKGRGPRVSISGAAGGAHQQGSPTNSAISTATPATPNPNPIAVSHKLGNAVKSNLAFKSTLAPTPENAKR